MENTFELTVIVNGTSYQETIDPRTLLSDFLRDGSGIDRNSCGL